MPKFVPSGVSEEHVFAGGPEDNLQHAASWPPGRPPKCGENSVKYLTVGELNLESKLRGAQSVHGMVSYLFT